MIPDQNSWIMGRVLRMLIFFTCLCVLVSVSLGQDTACFSKLVPCLPYINSTHTPSGSCCTPVKLLVNSDPGCLCSLLGGTTATKQAGVNATKAIQLPKRCGEKVNASLCKSKFQISNSCTCKYLPIHAQRGGKKHAESIKLFSNGFINQVSCFNTGSHKQKNIITSSAEFTSAKPALLAFLALLISELWILN